MWATSIGSTFSHSPLPGERKSGIPDGTEIPAPGERDDRPGLPDQGGEPVALAVHPHRTKARASLLTCHFGLRLPRKALMPSLPSST